MFYLSLSRRFTATIHRDAHSFNLPFQPTLCQFPSPLSDRRTVPVLQARQKRRLAVWARLVGRSTPGGSV
jgi:hypothetical protein